MPRQVHLLPLDYERPASRSRNLEDRHAALCRELDYERKDKKRLKSVMAFKDEMLLYTAGLLEECLRSGKPLGFERVKRLISQLKGAAAREQGGLPE